MLISITYGSHLVRSAYVIFINMILHPVFTMFVDLKTGNQTTSRQHRRKNAGILAVLKDKTMIWQIAEECFTHIALLVLYDVP